MMRIAALLATLTTCTLAQSQPEEAFVPLVLQSADQQRYKPEFLGTDENIAPVFLKVAEERHIELTDRKRVLNCPWSATSPTGYHVQVKIDRTKGDSAWGHFAISCTNPNRGGRGGFATGGAAILVRTDGKWSVAKWLDRFIT